MLLIFTTYKISFIYQTFRLVGMKAFYFPTDIFISSEKKHMKTVEILYKFDCLQYELGFKHKCPEASGVTTGGHVLPRQKPVPSPAPPIWQSAMCCWNECMSSQSPPKKNPCTTGCPAASLLVTPLPKTSHFQIWSWTSGSFMILIALIMIEGFIEVLFGPQVLEEALGEFEHHGHLAKESVSDSEVTITTHGTPMFLPVSRVSCTHMHCFLSSIFQQSLDFSPKNSFFWSL